MKLICLTLVLTFMANSGCGPRATSASARVAETPLQTAASTVFVPTPSREVQVSQTSSIGTSTPIAIQTLDARSRYLIGQPASNAIRFFLGVRDAVQANDKVRFADLVLYPTAVSIAKQDVVIRGSREFVEKYDAIITDGWRNKILAQDPVQLFSNWQGFMAGDKGQLWFSPICLDTKCEHTKWYIIKVNADF